MSFLTFRLLSIYIAVSIVIVILACLSESLKIAEEENPAVTSFRNYLRIETAHPNPKLGYNKAVEWLQIQAKDLDLDFNFLNLGEEDEFALWMTWNGSNPTLKSVLFSSHMDVVPADPAKWTYHPFEAYKDEQGNIFGRGTTDTKSATVATLEAIRNLKRDGFQPVRNIHILVMPEEEKGGFRGTRPFVKTEQFRNLNVGIDIDEGSVNPDNDTMAIWYAEKAVWQFIITARGEAGHGSTLPEFTAGQRLHVAIDELLQFREDQFRKLQNHEITVDQLTVLNLVQLNGGLAENIIPNEMSATFDMRIRLSPEWNFTDVEEMLNGILERSRLGPIDDPNNQVSIYYIAKTMETGETVTNDSNIWWTVVHSTCNELKVTCIPAVGNAATDGRYVRDLGIPVFGILPFLNTPFSAHQDNELINELEFLHGIDRYVALIRNLARYNNNSITNNKNNKPLQHRSTEAA